MTNSELLNKPLSFKNKLIIITGMHRSGTSALAGGMYSMGAYLGEKLMHATEDNPKGFFENEEIIRLNDKLLGAIGLSWKSNFNESRLAENQAITESVLDELKEYIATNYTGKNLAVIKDPRISVLMTFWNRMLSELQIQPYYIIMLRHPKEVAQSLLTRDRISFHKSFLLWMDYMLFAEYFSRKHKRIFVHYEKLLKKPQKVFDQLSVFCKIPQEIRNASPEFCEFVENQLRRNRFESIDEKLPGLVDELYKSLTTNPDQKSFVIIDTVAMDQIRTKYMELRKLFYNPDYKAENMELSTALNAQLFIDGGDGFTEGNSIVKIIDRNTDVLDFELDNNRKISSLRFDPVNTKVAIKICHIKYIDESGEWVKVEQFSHNAAFIINDLYVFETFDPNIIIPLEPIKQIKSVQIQLEYHAFGNEILSFVIQYKEKLLKKEIENEERIKRLMEEKEEIQGDQENKLNYIKQKYEKKLADMETELVRKNNLLNNLELEKELQNQEIRSIRNSFSFRLGYLFTAPGRWVYNMLNRGKLRVFTNFLIISFGRPVKALKMLNKENFRILVHAIRTEPPALIIANFRRNIFPELAGKQQNNILGSEGLKDAKQAAKRIKKQGAKAFEVYIDECLLLDNRIQVSGWAVSGSDIESIEVFLDGEHMGSARHGGKRPDLKKAFPEIKSAVSAGFYFAKRIKLPDDRKDKAGLKEVLLRVLDKSGHIRVLKRKIEMLNNDDYNLIKPDKTHLDEDIQLLTQQKAIKRSDASISVVIPTKNAGDEFPNLLKTLYSQKGFSSIEIIIVDSGSTDNTVKIAKEMGVKVVQIKPEEFTHSYSRNQGAEQARNQYLFFTVQDAMPSSSFLFYQLYYRLIKNNVLAATCIETPRADCDLFYRVTNRNHYRFLDVINKDKIFSHPGVNDHITLRKNAQLSDIALLINRALFMKYKYRLDYGEDLDLGLRLIKDGYKLLYAGTVKVIHSHNRPPYYFFRRGFVDSLYLKIRFEDFKFPAVKLNDIIAEIPALYNEIIRIIDEKLEKLHDFADHDEIEILDELDEFRKRKPSKTPSLRHSDYFDQETHDFISIINKKVNENNRIKPASGILVASIVNYHNIINSYMLDHYSRLSKDTIREYSRAIVRIFTLLTGAYLGYCYLNDPEDPEAKEIYSILKKNV